MSKTDIVFFLILKSYRDKFCECNVKPHMQWRETSVRLFGCPIITHESLDQSALKFHWKLGRTTGFGIAWL